VNAADADVCCDSESFVARALSDAKSLAPTLIEHSKADHYFTMRVMVRKWIFDGPASDLKIEGRLLNSNPALCSLDFWRQFGDLSLSDLHVCVNGVD
jgi:hypothetical protein